MAKTFSTLLPITFNVAEAIEYYNELKSNYQHLKWKLPTSAFRRVEDDTYEPTITGWGILASGDVNKPHQMIDDVGLQGREFYKETPCVFGFAKKLLDAFPTAFRIYLTVNTPGVEVLPHIDAKNMPRKTYRITIPIITNEDAVWTTEEGNVHMPAGGVYLIDWSIMHGTQNNGTTDRVHFMFEIFEEDIQRVKDMLVTI
jgi:hypothetical protein